MITEDYVSFETAKLLREKGFKEPTLAYAYGQDMIAYYSQPKITDDYNVEAGRYPLPTLQMACRWLMAVYNLFIAFKLDFSDGAYPMFDAVVYNLATCKKYPIINYDRYSSIKGTEAAIKYCLKNLI